MRVLICLPLLMTTVLAADEAGDRAAIEHIIDAVNHRDEAGAKEATNLFTEGAENELSRLSSGRVPWSELPTRPNAWPDVTPAKLTVRAIRFVTPHVCSGRCLRGPIRLANRGAPRALALGNAKRGNGVKNRIPENLGRKYGSANQLRLSVTACTPLRPQARHALVSSVCAGAAASGPGSVPCKCRTPA